MISKLDANDLFDVYGDLLTKRQREILSLYYEEDFSYTEISEELEDFSCSCDGFGSSSYEITGKI